MQLRDSSKPSTQDLSHGVCALNNPMGTSWQLADRTVVAGRGIHASAGSMAKQCLIGPPAMASDKEFIQAAAMTAKTPGALGLMSPSDLIQKPQDIKYASVIKTTS